MKKLIILKGKKVIFPFIAIFLVTSAAFAEDSVIKIGVLAKRGPERCIEKWSPTAEYLSSKIPEKTFVIVPIDFDQIYSVVEKSEVDFILANSSFYVELEHWYGINRIATLKNMVFSGIHTTFGGVVFCKKQREDIRQYDDLKGKTFMATSETSFGGWIMAWREFKEAGVDPFKNFASISFGGTHDAVVYAVQDGTVDAGTVRTDTLERMDAEGKISIDDFRIIHEHGGGNVHLPFMHSTREYPEWPIAKLKHTSNELAEKVAVALIGMPQDSAAAQAARCAGWTIPLNYQSVHECLKELKVGPYKDLGKITLTDIFRKYWILILIDLATLVVLAWFLSTHIILNRKIKKAYRGLELEVNERIQAEELFRKEKDKVLAYLDIAGVIIVVLNSDQSVAVINKKGCEILGYDESEIIGTKWFDNFLPERDRDQTRAVFSELIAGNIDLVKYYENYILTKDNKERLIAWNNSVLRDDDGKIIAILSSGEDITARKRAEEEREKMQAQMSNAVEMAHLGHWEYDVANDLFTFNDHFYKIFRTTAKQIGGYTMSSAEYARRFVHPDDMPVVEEEIRKAIEATDPHFSRQLEHRMIYADGTVGHITARFFIVKDAHGQTVKTYGVNQDITERKSQEAHLRQAQKMEAIGTLAGGVAHDFNNILTTIIGNAELGLMNTGKDDPLREEIEEIREAGRRAASLTRQLLAFSRKQVIQPKILDLNELLTSIEKMLGRLISEDVEILMIPEPELWRVEVDPGQMEQVIINLAINAKDAMPTGGKLTLETANKDLDENYFRERGIKDAQPGPYVMLAVSDTGIGIDKETQEQIFVPFFTTKEIGKGTGLGLSTVYGVVKQNNGFIWTYSEPGQGSTFKIYLPRATGDAVSEEKEQYPVTALGGSETVLIVEDDDSLRKLAQKSLQQNGYRVLAAENGEDALRVSKEYEGPIDLMVTDVVMPKMSGKETVERLQPLYPHMKVIYMSGYTDNSIVHHGVLAPGLNFMEKPFSPKNLARKVRETLDNE